MFIGSIKIPGRMCTKDGSRVGNAYCIKVIQMKDIAIEPSLEIETDFGNVLVLSVAEAEKLWFSVIDELPMDYKTWKKAKR